MTTTPTVAATVPLGAPPSWAVLERRLFDVLDTAWRTFAARYCEPDGRLIFRGTGESRDGADDFYEAFFNWPVLYQLGGADDLLAAAKHHWTGVTEQLTEAGYLVDEFERGYDWFHQGESLLLFYGICAADPKDAAFRDRAYRFADLYLPDSPAGNYDPATRTIHAPHNGAGGPRYGISDEWQSYHADLKSMRPFGLPLPDVAGVREWADLADPAKARAMGSAMDERIGRGDTAVNLAATGLAANAWLYGHEDRYRDWVLEYVDAWRERAAANDGVLPDNVGPHGVVGELHGGRWYGGNYGWAWPHGVYSVGAAAVIAALHTVLVTGSADRLDLARGPLDAVEAHGIRGTVAGSDASIRDRWEAELDVEAETLLVPNRYSDGGWFDFQPPQLGLSAWLWQAAGQPADRDRLDRLRKGSGYDWADVREFRNKEEAGHEAPWLEFLRGANPGYPEAMLRTALGQVARRLALIEADTSDPAAVHVHHWQRHNPVLTEALLQLATGTPQVLYNGGLLPSRLAYFDAGKQRPGLPPDVAALVDLATDDHVRVELVHIGLSDERRVVVQAGGFGEHRIDRVAYTAAAQGYPGDPRAYTAPGSPASTRTADVGGPRLEVVLPPGHGVRLDLFLTPRAYPAAHHSFDE
ncbi:hypothetical protein [Amycolatopsis sp. NPDC050768]|uniref:hypothetical protein n=1 Tax=Amycolatopsis sp. NPDC050768 TaxID=3154839 RepID=UPI0033C85E30